MLILIEIHLNLRFIIFELVSLSVITYVYSLSTISLPIASHVQWVWVVELIIRGSVPASDVPTSQMGRSTTPCGTLHNLSGEKKKKTTPLP